MCRRIGSFETTKTAFCTALSFNYCGLPLVCGDNILYERTLIWLVAIIQEKGQLQVLASNIHCSQIMCTQINKGDLHVVSTMSMSLHP